MIANSSPTSGNTLYISGQDVSVEGFGVTGGRTAVSLTNSNESFISNHVYNVFVNGTATSTGASGIDVFTNGYSGLSGITVDRNQVDHVGTPGRSGLVQGIYVSIPCPSCLVTNNVVYSVEDFGLHAYHNPAYWIFANNTVVGSGDGILAGPQFTVINNIAYGNLGDDYKSETAQTVTGSPTFTADLSYANGSQSGYSGVTVANPMFVNASGDDFHLNVGSPAIDRGTPTDAPPLDFSGTPRPQGAGYDIGAYERVQAAPHGPTAPSPNPPARPGTAAPSSKIKALLSAILVPHGKRAKIKALLAHGGYSFRWTAPGAGRLRISWHQVRKGARLRRRRTPVLVAKVSRTFSRSRRFKFTIALTRRGRRLLRSVRRVKLRAKASFAPRGKSATTMGRGFTLRR